MRPKILLEIAALASLGGSAPGSAESYGFNLHAVVPVMCQLRHTDVGAGATDGNIFSLGQINESCNAPTGYEIVVNYTPGTLNGTVLAAGEDHVTLNGSGEAILSRAPGPRIRNRPLTATPGEHGFDTDRLNFEIHTI
jgi:hypothetical protein